MDNNQEQNSDYGYQTQSAFPQSPQKLGTRNYAMGNTSMSNSGSGRLDLESILNPANRTNNFNQNWIMDNISQFTS